MGHANTYIATDAKIIADVVREAGFKVVMTSPDALTGTDRIAEAIREIEADVFINVQGDEDGKLIAQQAAIEILDFADDQVYVRGLLEDGDRVVAAGTHRVVPGMIVIPTDAR